MTHTTERDRLVVVTAVNAETRAVLAASTRPQRVALPGLRAWDVRVGGRPVTLVQAGIGPERAHAALTAVPVPHGLVVSIGFAGALIPTAVPGDLILPDTVVWEDESGRQRYAVPVAALEAARGSLPEDLRLRILHGPVLSSSIVVASPSAKRAAAGRFGAVAVEMEAAGLVGVACGRGVGVLVLRAILDTADVSLEGLPSDSDSSWRARAQLLSRPGTWPGVLTVARHIPRVARALTQAAAAVLPSL